jgi:integrase
MGYLYQRKMKSGNRTSTWWMKYYVDGRPKRVSTGADDYDEARRRMKAREGKVAMAQPILPRADRVKYEEIAEDLRQHYRATGTRGLDEAEARLKHLDPFFRGRRVSAIGTTSITDYVVKRQGEGAANGTINRELGVLGRMLRLACEAEKLQRLPVMHKPKEAPPRAGFFEREQYEAVRRHLSPDLQVAAAIAHECGWRTQSEVLTLERRQIDLEAGAIRLDAGTTKTDEGREVYVSAELKAALAAQVERVRVLERKLGRIIPHLFPHLSGRRRAGARIADYRKAWATACKKAGVAGRLRHDLRRTAVRDMVNLGVPEKVAMTVTGHQTRAVFDRYHIVSPADLREVARKRDAAQRRGTLSGHTPGGGLETHPVSL